jgi:CRISPR/Cas system-associated endoribonuclease Cas2
VAQSTKLSRFFSSVSFKDVITLGFLLCVDYVAFGYDYARLPGRKPLQSYPFENFRDYLEKITKKKVHKVSSFYNLRKFGVLDENENQLSINLTSDWWRDYFNLKFRFFVSPQKWDGFWTVVIFDIPEEERGRRREVRNYLKHLGFVQWQRSVWVTVNNVKNQIQRLFEKNQTYLFAFRAESLFEDRDEEIINKLFKPHELEDKFAKFIDRAKFVLKSRDISQAKQLILEFPELILEDRGAPGDFFERKNIRQELFSKVKLLNKLIS